MNYHKQLTMEEFKTLPIDEVIAYFVSRAPIPKESQEKLRKILEDERKKQ